MRKELTDRTLLPAMRSSLNRIDSIESEIAASIDRFADGVGAKLRNAIEHSASHAEASSDKRSPYPDNGPVTG